MDQNSMRSEAIHRVSPLVVPLSSPDRFVCGQGYSGWEQFGREFEELQRSDRTTCVSAMRPGTELHLDRAASEGRLKLLIPLQPRTRGSLCQVLFQRLNLSLSEVLQYRK